MTALPFPTCELVGNGTRFGTIRGFKRSWPVQSRRRSIKQYITPRIASSLESSRCNASTLYGSTQLALRARVKNLKQTTTWNICLQTRRAPDATLQNFPQTFSVRAKVCECVPVFSLGESFRAPKPQPGGRCFGHLRDASPRPWRWLA